MSARTRSLEARARSRVVQEHGFVGQNRLVPYLFSTPAIVAVSVILAFPVLYALFESLFTEDFLGAPERFVGLGNYTDLLVDPAFWGAFRRSVTFIAGCIVLGQVLAIIFAFALNRAIKRLRFLRGLVIMPYIVSSVAAAVMFRIVFNRDFGLPNQFLQLFGIQGPAWLVDPALAMFVVIVAQVWTDLPLSILVIFGGLQTVEPSLLDAASVDGASAWKRARYVSFPLIAPQLALSTLWLSYTCLTSLGTILALTGGGPGTSTQTLTMEMYSTAFERLDFHGAMAIATLILLLNAALSLVYIKVGSRYDID